MSVDSNTAGFAEHEESKSQEHAGLGSLNTSELLEIGHSSGIFERASEITVVDENEELDFGLTDIYSSASSSSDSGDCPNSGSATVTR